MAIEEDVDAIALSLLNGAHMTIFSEVKKLAEDFKIICSTFCEKNESINKRLKNIEAKDELKQ